MPDFDDLLSRSLHDDAASYRPLGDASEQDVIRRIHRRRAARTSALAVVVLALAAGAAFGVRALGTTKPHLVTPSGDFVPWVDTAPQAAPEPSATPASATTPDCNAADLQAKWTMGGAATGHLPNVLAIATKSSSDCALQGRPSLRLIDTSGAPLYTTQQAESYIPDHGDERVLVRAGTPLPSSAEDTGTNGLGLLVFEWVDCTTAQVSFVDVTLPNGGGTLRIATPQGLNRSQQAFCDANPGSTSSTLYVDNFQSIAPTAAPAPDYSALRASLDAPATASVGERLHYFVTLTNPTAQDVVFDPCPAYSENITGIKAIGAYELNCDGAASIRAGSSVTFEMYLSIPAGVAAGSGQLVWQLGDQVTATSPITVG
jgi:hypothetical protein